MLNQKKVEIFLLKNHKPYANQFLDIAFAEHLKAPLTLAEWSNFFENGISVLETRRGTSVRSGEYCLWVKIFVGVGFGGIKYYATVETRRGASLILLYLWLWRRAAPRLYNLGNIVCG